MKKLVSVGLIGLGKIGNGLAKNFIKAGYTLYVLDLDKAKQQEMVALGAVSVDTPKAMAEKTSHIFLSVFNAATVETVLFGQTGIARAKTETKVTAIDTTTVAPEYSRPFAQRLAEVSMDYLDAPITGGEHGAQKGTLFFMVGGSKEAFAGSTELFEAVGSRSVLVGDAGAGAVAKMVNQLLMIAQMAGVAECAGYSEMQGVDFGKVLEAINPDLSSNMYVQGFNARRLDAQMTPASVVKAKADHYTALFLKDMQCVLEFGKVQPIAAAGASMLKAALDNDTDGPFTWSLKTGWDSLQKCRIRRMD